MGICGAAKDVRTMFNTTRYFVEGRRGGRHDRDARGGHASGRDAPPRGRERVGDNDDDSDDDDSGHVSIAYEDRITSQTYL